MQRFLFLLMAVCLSACASGQAYFELDGNQSMCITGKGPGQDGAINPYMGEDSRGIVKNIGDSSIDVRIQEKGELIEIITVEPRETREVALMAGYELYLDSEREGKARVSFKKVR